MSQYFLVVMLLIFDTGVNRALGEFNDTVPKVSFCELASNPNTYDGKIVNTEALVGSRFHSVDFDDPTCGFETAENRGATLVLSDDWLSTKLGRKLSKILRSGHTARVGLDGVFHGTGGPYGGDGTRFEFVMRHLLSVSEIQNKKSDSAK